MAFNTKALALGGIGCIVAITYGLIQPEYSPTILEKLGQDGYELISEKEDEIWKERANLYKVDTNQLLLKDLTKESVDEDGKKIKERCEEYKKKTIRFKDIGEEGYKKVTLFCTLNIGEYIKRHLSDKEELITVEDNIDDWKENFEKYEKEIKEKIKDATKDKAKEVLTKFCAEAFKLQHSNENKEDKIRANLWCIKRYEKPEESISNWYSFL